MNIALAASWPSSAILSDSVDGFLLLFLSNFVFEMMAFLHFLS